MFRFYLPLKGRNPLFEQIWFLFTQWWFVSSSIKIGLVVLEENLKIYDFDVQRTNFDQKSFLWIFGSGKLENVFKRYFLDPSVT